MKSCVDDPLRLESPTNASDACRPTRTRTVCCERLEKACKHVRYGQNTPKRLQKVVLTWYKCWEGRECSGGDLCGWRREQEGLVESCGWLMLGERHECWCKLAGSGWLAVVLARELVQSMKKDGCAGEGLGRGCWPMLTDSRMTGL